MADFARARRMMVDGQIRTNDVTDLRLLAAFLDVPRERFVPAEEADLAYLDLDLPLRLAQAGQGRRLLKPMVLARLIQAAMIEPEDAVLDIGCATGYAAAVMAQIAGRVVALEEDASLVRTARAALASTSGKVIVEQGRLADGAPAHGPYDAIVIEGQVEFVPRALCDQLAEGGRLVCIEGTGVPGRAMRYTKTAGEVSGRPVFDANGPILPGFSRPPAFVF